MKQVLKAVSFVVFAGVSVSVFAMVAQSHEAPSFAQINAAQVKMVGVLTKIEIADSGATVMLRDERSGEEIEIIINDSATIDKLKNHRIIVSDTVMCTYVEQDGKKVSVSFRLKPKPVEGC